MIWGTLFLNDFAPKRSILVMHFYRHILIGSILILPFTVHAISTREYVRLIGGSQKGSPGKNQIGCFFNVFVYYDHTLLLCSWFSCPK